MESSRDAINASTSTPDLIASSAGSPPTANVRSASSTPSASLISSATTDVSNVEEHNTAAVPDDDFLSWDPWGDDSERYPDGFWNQIPNSLIGSQRPSGENQPTPTQLAAVASETIRDTSSEDTIPTPDGEIQEDSIDEESQKKTEDEGSMGRIDEKLVLEGKVNEQDHDVFTGSEKECTVCLESLAEDQYPEPPHANKSTHGSDVCLGCWEQHLESEIKSKGFEGVSCLQCSIKLLENEMRKLARDSTYTE